MENKLIRTLYKFAYRIHLIYWKFFRPVTLGVRALLVKDNRIVLVKHSYQNQWCLPGGGVKRRESLEDAIRRELREELGEDVGSIELLGVYSNFYEGKSDHIVLFLIREFESSQATSWEVSEIKMFSPDNLPPNIFPGSKRRIDEFLRGKRVLYDIW